jgi:uncharacterized protein (TIGR03435 family)
MSWESQLVAFLSASLVRPLFLVVAALLILRMFRVRHPASLYAVWTAVLMGVLLLPLISVMSPHVNLPVLPAKSETPYTVGPLPSVESVAPTRMADPGIVALPVPPLQPVTTPWGVPWSTTTLVTWLYLAGVLAMAARAALGWTLMRRVVSRSIPLRGPLRRLLRESSDLVVPVAVGLLHPVVILPSGWRGWSRETRRAVLAHEFAHIRRRDAMGAALGRLAKCVFWFHPLAWAISRKVAELAELACDAAALQSVPDPSSYSRVLLQFAGGVRAAGRRTILPGLAMANSSGLHKRIDRVFELSDGNMRRLVRPGLILASMGVPVMCLAATVGLRERTRVSPVVSQVISQVAPAAQIERPPITLAQAPSPAPAPQPVKPALTLMPAFDKATLEIAGPPISGELCWGGCGGPGTPYPESQNEITYRHFTLKNILLRAYDLKDFQIVVPDEFNTPAYTIQATAPVGTSKEQFQLMLRNLLAEKLDLTLHHETRDFVSNYDLVVASGGPKLRESLTVSTPADFTVLGLVLSSFKDGRTPLGGPPAGMIHSVSVLAKVLASALQTPVDDKTGLTGNYNLNYSEFLSPPVQQLSDGRFRIQIKPSLSGVNARLERLGLVLEEKHGPMDVLVIDHVDSLPRN